MFARSWTRSSETHQVKSRWITNYTALRKQLEQMEKDVKQRGEEGQKAWFAQVAGDNKTQAAAAIRLLMYDLRSFLTRNNGLTTDVREAAIEKLTVCASSRGPRSRRSLI